MKRLVPACWKRQKDNVVLNGSVGSLDIQLEWFEFPANGGTTRALSYSPLFLHHDIDASPTEPADTLGACVGLSELRHPLASGTVDMDILGRVTGGRVGKASGANVKMFATSRSLHGWEWVKGLLGVRRWCESLL